MGDLSRFLDAPVRVVFYEVAVVNFVRVGMWQGLGYDPFEKTFTTLDTAFADLSVVPATNLSGMYSTLSILSILLSIGIVVVLGRKWGVVTIVISFFAGVGIGAGSILGTLLVLPSMLLGVYAPLTESQGNSPQHAPPLR